MMNTGQSPDHAPQGNVPGTEAPSDLQGSKRRNRAAWLVVALLLPASGYALYSGLRPNAGPVPRDLDFEKLIDPSRVYSKLHREGDKAYLWAYGKWDFDSENSEWFDMTGSPLPLEKVNHGIGRDTIAAIDDPVFVDADDPRLRRKWGGRDDADIDWLQVIGYAHNGVARAYPIRLLNRHELVNDTVGGKPVTVGW